MGKSERTGRSRLSISAEKRFAACIEEMASPFCFAHSSAAKRPFTSVAVVITGRAPMAEAMRRVSSLAPPMWPDSSDTA